MAIDSNTGEIISLPEAVNFVTAFQVRFPHEARAFFVGSNKITDLLEQPDCIGVRIYNGYDESEQVLNRVLVGVDSFGEDIAKGVIVEKLAPCPTICSANSPLNP